MNLPPAILDFITKAITTHDICLPQNYPAPDEFEKFQEGYRFNAVTGADLTGQKEGDFKSSWYVIAQNYFNDPYFIDLTEADSQFPVYYAQHGAGTWKPVKVAAGIGEFAAILSEIITVQEDKVQVLNLLRSRTDQTNELWKEVYTNFEEEEA